MRVHGGRAEKGWLDFSASINPLGTPPEVEQALLLERDGMLRYPHPRAEGFVRAVAGFHGISAENIVAGNGSTELIWALARSLADKTHSIVEPAFCEYRAGLQAAGADLSTGVAQVTWIANPGNPDGILKPAQEILAQPGLKIVDEAFLQFSGDHESLVHAATQRDDVLVLRSMTKFYALPGLRLGYLVGHPERMAQVNAQLPPWNVNAYADVAGQAALQAKAWAKDAKIKVAAWRNDMATELLALGLTVSDSSANYLLVQMPDAHRAERALSEKKIAVRICDDFFGLEPGRFMRLAVRTPQENERVLHVFSEMKGLWQAAR